MTNLTFGSLFAGIGGIDLGLERAGMTCNWWGAKAGVRRGTDGIPVWLDGSGRVAFVTGESCPDRRQRLKSLGNAVVPQVAEWIGRQIVAEANR